MPHGQASKVVLALALLAACDPPPRHLTEVSGGAAVVACRGAPAIVRRVPEAGEDVYVCLFGGRIACDARRCAVLEVLADERRERWEYLCRDPREDGERPACRGQHRRMAAHFEYYVRDKSATRRGAEVATRATGAQGGLR